MLYIFKDTNQDGHEERRESSPETIEEDLRDWIRDGDWAENEATVWLDAAGWPAADPAARVDVTLAIDPEVPDCEDGRDHHAWGDAHVRGHGGGVITREECEHCGLARVEDTWAHRPDTGEQGLRSVTFTRGES